MEEPKQPNYEDLMTIVNKLREIEDIALFTKYFVLHLCKDILKLPDDTFNYLAQMANEASDKAKKGLLNDNTGIWN